MIVNQGSALHCIFIDPVLVLFLPQELQLAEGDIITVVGREDEIWWCGNLNGRIGMFPSSYVESYMGQ